jgi:hypothetical protein
MVHLLWQVMFLVAPGHTVAMVVASPTAITITLVATPVEVAQHITVPVQVAVIHLSLTCLQLKLQEVVQQQ